MMATVATLGIQLAAFGLQVSCLSLVGGVEGEEGDDVYRVWKALFVSNNVNWDYQWLKIGRRQNYY